MSFPGSVSSASSCSFVRVFNLTGIGGSGGLDQVPKLGVLLEGLIFADGKIRAEEKIFERVFAEDSVDDEAEIVALEVDAVVADPEPVQRPPFPFQFSEAFQLGGHHLLRKPSEFAEDIELKFLGHSRQFGGAGGVEDDLEGSHKLVARTGVEPVFRP